MRFRIAVALAALTVVLAVCRVVLLAVSDRLWTNEAIIAGFPLVDVGAVTGAVIGALIISRYPGHRVGWLFVVGQLLTEVGVTSHAFGVAALREEVPGYGLGPPAVAVGLQLGAFPTLALLALLFLLAPAGEWPSGRWRAGIWLSAVGLVLHALGLSTVHTDRINDVGQVPGPDSGFALPLVLAGYLCILAAVVTGAASLFVRLRRSEGRVREQLTWITLAAVVLAATAMFTFIAVEFLNVPAWFSVLPLMAAYAAVPVLTGISILRHQLFGVDVVLNRAIVLTLLSSTATLLYVSAVVVVSGPAPSSMRDLGLFPSMVITALVALLLQPVRARASRVAGRLVYGAQADPYIALASFTRELQDVPHPQDMLTGVAQAIGRTVGASAVRLSIDAAAQLDWRPTVITWSHAQGNQGANTPHWTAPVRADRGTVVGHVAVTMPPGRGLRTLERQLLVDYTTQIGHALSNVRLGAELSARADELRVSTERLEASRRRLVTARHEERERFEAAIRHVVLPHLTPLPGSLRQLASMLESDHGVGSSHEDTARGTSAASSIDELIVRSNQAVEALRTVTRGVFPAQLARRGVPAALLSHVRTARPRARVTVQDWWSERRMEARRESTLYFAVVDLLDTMPVVDSVELTAETAPDRAVIVITGPTHRASSSRMRLLADRLSVFDGTVRLSQAAGGQEGFVIEMLVDPRESPEQSGEVLPRGQESLGIE